MGWYLWHGGSNDYQELLRGSGREHRNCNRVQGVIQFQDSSAAPLRTLLMRFYHKYAVREPLDYQVKLLEDYLPGILSPAIIFFFLKDSAAGQVILVIYGVVSNMVHLKI